MADPVGPPIFTEEGPEHYDAAFKHNSPFAQGAPYKTALTGPQETAFRAWVAANNVPTDPDEDPTDYDMRGFYKASMIDNTIPDWTGPPAHFPDTFKTPYDTTFSKESQYATPDCPFEWVDNPWSSDAADMLLVDSRDGQIVFGPPGVGKPAAVEATTTQTVGVGADEWSKTLGQIQRENVPVNYWHKKGPVLHFGLEKWRVWWVPREGQKTGIGHLVESIGWVDENAVLTGDVHLREPAFSSVGVENGDEIMVEFSTDGSESFQELWRMRVWQTSPEFVGDTNTLNLQNALGWLQRSTDDFKYVAGKTRKDGWTCDEITLDICQRYGVPTGPISAGTHKIKKFVFTSISPLRAIALAYQREAAANARWFVFRMNHGLLEVVPLQRNSRMLELGPSLVSAMYQQGLQETFSTAVTVRGTARAEKGTDKKGKKKKAVSKLVVVVQSAASIARFGYIHRNVTAPDANSFGEARTTGLRTLVRNAQPDRLLTLSHPGIPSIKRGDAIRVVLPDEELQQLVYITSVTHNLSSANYTMDLQVQFTDPIEDAKLARVKAQRAAAAKKRKRKAADKTTAKADKKSQHANKDTPGDRLIKAGMN